MSGSGRNNYDCVQFQFYTFRINRYYNPFFVPISSLLLQLITQETNTQTTFNFTKEGVLPPSYLELILRKIAPSPPSSIIFCIIILSCHLSLTRTLHDGISLYQINTESVFYWNNKSNTYFKLDTTTGDSVSICASRRWYLSSNVLSCIFGDATSNERILLF